MLRSMAETYQKSPSDPPGQSDPNEWDESVAPADGALALPSHIAGSGTLDRLVETARDYARHAASENTLKAYAKAAGDLRGVADQRLEEMGRRRQIVLGLPAFLPALAAVAESGALLTLPSRLARWFAPAFGLVTATPPIELRSFPVSVFRHRRTAFDARTDWMIRQLAETVVP